MNNTPSPSSPQLNATVMASAGTGKTYMLVNRLVRLLLAGARPDAILAITFTRKAAAEMQSRLSERLLALAAAPSEQLAAQLGALEVEPTAETLARASQLFEYTLQNRLRVRTTTFHAFCQEILLRFPLEADVPPGFELLESSAELTQAAWNALLAEASGDPDGELAGALQLLLEYCGNLTGMQSALNNFLAHRGDWWAFTEQADDALGYAGESLRNQLQLEPGTDPLQAFFSAARDEELAEFAALLAKHPNKGNNEALEALADARNPELTMQARLQACSAAFLTKSGTPRARKANKTQAGKMGEAGQERFLALHETTSEALLHTLDRCKAQQLWQASRAWLLAGSRLLHHYQLLKQEQRLLDFNDLEWRAYRLLNHGQNALWVQYKLDQRIDHLLVDEFQDTNPTQWRLLLPLLQEMAAGSGETARSVFLVGDAKQSIYRFRRAEPRLFHAAHEWLSTHLDARAFPLHTSWRSAPAIMQCVNRVFGEEGPLYGVLRDFSAHDTHHGNLWGEVTLLPLIEAAPGEEEPEEAAPQTLRNPLQTPRLIPPDDRYREEGRQIAATIQQLIDNATTIGEGDKARPIHYGDIMLLVRKRTHIGYYEQALRDAQIPYIGAERGTLLQSLEVRDMVALLEVLHTPYNNLSLASVLRSPLFGCDDTALMQLAGQGGGDWYTRLLTLAPGLPSDAPLAVAADALQRWQALTGQIPIHDLLDRIFSEGNVLARYQAAFPAYMAASAVANLTRFLELALEVDSGRYPSLGHFLARLEGMRQRSDEAPDEAPAAGGNQRVRLLTIHASKGLEAPVVFLADAGQGDGSDKGYRALPVWPPEAPRPEGFLLIGRQEQQPEAIRERLEQEKREQARESANLLYVAITRARQLLYISGVKPNRGKELGWYGVLQQALDPHSECDTEHPATLSTGTPPQPVHPAVTPPASQPACDPRLSQPLELTREHHEIAPSLGGDTTTGLPAAGDEEDGRLRGVVIHRLLQLLSENEKTDWPTQLSRVAAEFSLEADDPQFLQWSEGCRQLLMKEELQTVFRPRDGVESFNEVPIIYSLDGQTVHGIIDRLLVADDGVWLIDYKSHRQATPGNCDRLAEAYRRQLGYYAAGVKKLWPDRPLRCFLLFTTPGLLHEVTVA